MKAVFPLSPSLYKFCHLENFCLQNDTGTNYYKEIPLSEILAVSTAKKASDVQHCFEIRTANVDYFVGQDAQKSTITSGLGSDWAKEWETAIRKALMPVIVNPEACGTNLAPPQHYQSHRYKNTTLYY